MKERPILFSGPMVRAILEGRKTQTRRILKDPLDKKGGQFCVEYADDDPNFLVHVHSPKCGGYCDYACHYPCPYGQVGDRLWVRESFNWSADDELLPGENHKKCPEREGWNAKNVVWAADGERTHPEWGKALWKPSIHMPRWASRITLSIKGVRVERLQAISPDDLVAEGIGEMTRALISKYEAGWEPQCWLHSNGGPSYCRCCAEKALQESTAEDDCIDGGYPGASIESDYLETCEGCGKMLETALISDDFACYLPDEDGVYMEHPPCAEEVAMLASYSTSLNESAVNREVFRVFWDLLNGKRPGCAWADNPWVWVVEYDNPLWGKA